MFKHKDGLPVAVLKDIETFEKTKKVFETLGELDILTQSFWLEDYAMKFIKKDNEKIFKVHKIGSQIIDYSRTENGLYTTTHDEDALRNFEIFIELKLLDIDLSKKTDTKHKRLKI